MSISIVIPAYNAEGFIEGAVRSALDQTFPPLEVLVVDDASSDETKAVVSEMARQEPRIRLLALERNGGPAAARNAGFEAARGDWIAILDADDAYERDRLQALFEVAAAGEADMIADNIVHHDRGAGQMTRLGVRSVTDRMSIDARLFLEKSQGNQEDIDFGLLKPMFRRSFLQGHRLGYRPEMRHGEDFALYMDCLLAGARWVFTPHPGYIYTERWGSVSGEPSGMSRTRIDYFAIAKQTEGYLSDSRIASDTALSTLISQRRERMLALGSNRRLVRLKRAFSGLWRMLCEEPKALPGFILDQTRRVAAALRRA